MTQQALDTLRKADAIDLDEIRRAGLYDAIWQAFAVRDGRRAKLRPVLALRTVTSVGGMTADFLSLRYGLPRPRLDPHHQRGEGHQPRAYDVTSKPPGTIEWE